MIWMWKTLDNQAKAPLLSSLGGEEEDGADAGPVCGAEFKGFVG